MELTLHGKFGGPLAPTELAVMLIRVVASDLLVSRAGQAADIAMMVTT